MTKEKLEKLTTYLNKMKSKLADPLPPKHKDHPETYKAFMHREIRLVQAQLDEAKLEGVAVAPVAVKK